MTGTLTNQIFAKSDGILEASLNHRLSRQNVILSNIANAATPGYRALGYDFEKQLQSVVGQEKSVVLKTTQPQHILSPGLSHAGNLKADLFVKPTESLGNDGNTVNVDEEMSDMASNQILYNATVELLNRRLGMLRYGITGGGH